MILFEAFWVFLFYFAFDMAQIWHRPEGGFMLIELNENMLRCLYQEDSVAVADSDKWSEEAEEIAEAMPDEYCDPMAEFRMI